MRKTLWSLFATVALTCAGSCVTAAASDYVTDVTGVNGVVTPTVVGGTINVPTNNLDFPAGAFSTLANASYASQISFDSFRYSVRKRMESTRIGSTGSAFGNPFSSRSGYTGGRESTYYNRGGGYYNQNYNPQWGGGAPQGQYNQNWNPPPLPAPQGQYNAPSGYDPYGGNVNTNWNNDTWNQQVGQGYSYNGDFASGSAYAMAPSSRSGSYSSASRRMLDCVYYSGFTVWADLYQTWSKQKSRGSTSDGYKYRTFGPAIGVDWTNGPLTVGAAMTYNWGRINGLDTDNRIKLRTWGIDLYAQYNTDNWYVNGTLGYAHNRYKSDRNTTALYHQDANTSYYVNVPNHSSFTSNAWNIDVEYGWKLNWQGIQVVPNVGLRYYHDRRGGFDENGANLNLSTHGRNYHVLEMPMAVNFAYEIAGGGRVWVPRARVAWIPELTRKSASSSGSVNWNGTWLSYGESASKRNRHGFQIGLGLEAKLSKSLSAHIDYNCNFRSKAYEHHWNFGAGFTF